MAEIKDIRKKTQKLTILCVDDEKSILHELSELLKIFFAKVYITDSAEVALEIYTKYQSEIDLVLTDINMPQMDGITLSQKIKEINILEYIIVSSARQDIEFYKNCIKVGIDDIVVKPITSEAILKSLEKYLIFVKQIKDQKLSCIQKEKNFSVLKNNELYIDHITGLFNKSKLDEFLFVDKEYSLTLANIDNFDHINCKYGYRIGDHVLKEIGDIFLRLIEDKNECNVFRVVSDEFVFLLQNKDQDKMEKLCHKILKELSKQKIETEMGEFSISCTLGVSSGKGQDLLRQAHIAMKESRQIGKEKYYFFTNNSEIIKKREKNLKWLNKIKDVLKKEAVIPYYQSVINNKDNSIEFYESLARILEINRIVQPYYFLESAKLFNLMPDITSLMIKKVFQFAKENPYIFSINITQEDILTDEFIEYIFNMAETYETNSKKIIFEFSELVTITENEKTFENLKKLTDNGFQLAIDDFGGSHYNMKNLHSLKISYLKINSIFIEKLLEDKKAKSVVESIIVLAKNIGAKTIAQSVSNKKIQKEVKSMGIDLSQGYFICKPSEVIQL
jgi:diguanylate cyclase (GGDEF)-like protein